MLDRLLKRIGDVLADDDSRRGLLERLGRGLGFLIRFFLYSYGAFLLFAVFGFHWIGENNITTAFALYLPRVILLLPVPFLLFVALFNGWKPPVFLLVASVSYWIGGMGYELRPVPERIAAPPGEAITVLTYNRGQHMSQSLQPFMNLTGPDVIAFQEAPVRASRYLGAEGYEVFVAAESIGEFTVLSKYPILSSELIHLPNGPGVIPTAARFELDFQGQPMALYVVHVISPRDALLYYRMGAFLQGVLGIPGTPWGRKRERNQEFWDRRMEEARELGEVIEKDPLPSLLVGDLNAPAGGAIHRILRKTLIDAHLESGSGFGYTFPGVTRNPLSRGGPWMRIDYLFCDDNWEPVWCLTEEERKSQHRAVTAQFRLRSSPD